MTAAPIRPAESPFATKLVVLLRVLLGAMSVAGLLLWAYLTFIMVAWGAIVVPSLLLTLLFGYFYLLLSLYLCFKNPPIPILTPLGAVLNLPLVIYVVYLLWTIEDKLQRTAFVPLTFVFVWFLFWLLRWLVAKNVSPSRQILAIVLVLASATAGVAALVPLTISPYGEVQRLSEAGARATNPDEAKRLFAKAEYQANRIRSPSSRDNPLGVVAYNQAKAGLIQDAEVTAKKCKTEAGQKSAFNSIVRAQVESGDLRGAVVTAKSYDSGAVLFMALKEISIAKAKAGQVESAKEIIRFAEQTAQDPVFESLTRWSFADVAMAQAQLGLHDEALSSARKTGAEYAPEHMAFVAVTEKEAGYLEQSRASVQEAIRGVMALPKDAVSKDSILYELASRLSDSGLYEEALLVADSMQSENTKAIIIRTIDSAKASRSR